MSKLIVEGRGCELFGGKKNVGLDEKLLGEGWLQGWEWGHARRGAVGGALTRLSTKL